MSAFAVAGTMLSLLNSVNQGNQANIANQRITNALALKESYADEAMQFGLQQQLNDIYIEYEQFQQEQEAKATQYQIASYAVAAISLSFLILSLKKKSF